MAGHLRQCLPAVPDGVEVDEQFMTKKQREKLVKLINEYVNLAIDAVQANGHRDQIEIRKMRDCAREELDELIGDL